MIIKRKEKVNNKVSLHSLVPGEVFELEGDVSTFMVIDVRQLNDCSSSYINAVDIENGVCESFDRGAMVTPIKHDEKGKR